MVLRAQQGGQPVGAILAGLAALACVAVGLLGLERLSVTLCPFKAVTGFPCMTCGTTRVLGRLFALDLGGAISMNPLAALGAVAVVPWALADLWLLSRGASLSFRASGRESSALGVTAVVAVLANWAYLIAAGR